MALRILSICRFLPNPSSPQAGGFVLSRLAAMARREAVTIVQPIPYFPMLRRLPDWARSDSHEHDGLRIHHAPMFYVPGILKALDGHWLARSVRLALGRLGGPAAFDVLDSHFGYPDGVGAVLAAREAGLPAFVTIRGLETDLLQHRRIGRMLVDGLNAAAGVISVSYSLRELVVEHGVDPARIRVIPNAVDRSCFRPAERIEAREKLGLQPHRPLIVCVGNLIALKRHHVLIEAFARLREVRDFDGQLVLIGAGEAESAYETRLRALAASRELADSITFTGRLPADRVATWLQAADVFALATSREGCCNAVLEALACGTPVVTTRAGDNAHYVRPGENGELVSIDDVAGLQEALQRVLHFSGWDRARISNNLESGGWEDVADGVLEFFHQRRAAA